MIALLLGFLMFGVLGIAAYAVVILVLGSVLGVFYWTWRLARFLVLTAWRAVVGLARLVRFVVMAFVHVGADVARAVAWVGRKANA